MAVFARRRLQAMLDESAANLGPEKLRDLRSRLEDKRVEQALPAEIELGLMWAIGKLGTLEAEPEWWRDERRPDVYTEHLFKGYAAAVEIAAPSDNTIAGEAEMELISRKFAEFANTVRRGLGDYLYFEFAETSGYKDGIYFRHRLAPADFIITEELADGMREWLLTERFTSEKLTLSGRGLLVRVEKRSYKQNRFSRFFSSMPPEAHSLEDNHLFQLLKHKRRQVRAAEPGVYKFIFLGDVGSTLLHRVSSVGERDSTGRRVSGSEIICHFLRRFGDEVDGVVIFSPRRSGYNDVFSYRNLSWAVTPFIRDGLVVNWSGLEQAIAFLPRPRFEGYQVRSLHRQGAFSLSGRGHYLPLTFSHSFERRETVCKLSSRCLLDLLAGRITFEQFMTWSGLVERDVNVFHNALQSGQVISDVRIESGGLDRDDDYVVFEFRFDPSALALRVLGEHED